MVGVGDRAAVDARGLEMAFPLWLLRTARKNTLAGYAALQHIFIRCSFMHTINVWVIWAILKLVGDELSASTPVGQRRCVTRLTRAGSSGSSKCKSSL